MVKEGVGRKSYLGKLGIEEEKGQEEKKSDGKDDDDDDNDDDYGDEDYEDDEYGDEDYEDDAEEDEVKFEESKTDRPPTAESSTGGYSSEDMDSPRPLSGSMSNNKRKLTTSLSLSHSASRLPTFAEIKNKKLHEEEVAAATNGGNNRKLVRESPTKDGKYDISASDEIDILEDVPVYLKGGKVVVGFGPLLGYALALLYVSRHGLKENELFEMLAKIKDQEDYVKQQAEAEGGEKEQAEVEGEDGGSSSSIGNDMEFLNDSTMGPGTGSNLGPKALENELEER